MTRPPLRAPSDLEPLRELLDGRWRAVREEARRLAEADVFQSSTTWPGPITASWS
jgi:hypothetical protein